MDDLFSATVAEIEQARATLARVDETISDLEWTIAETTLELNGAIGSKEATERQLQHLTALVRIVGSARKGKAYAMIDETQTLEQIDALVAAVQRRCELATYAIHVAVHCPRCGRRGENELRAASASCGQCANCTKSKP